MGYAILIIITIIVGIPIVAYLIGKYFMVGFFAGKEFMRKEKEDKH